MTKFLIFGLMLSLIISTSLIKTSTRDLDEIYKFLELERRIGSHNMATEGGKFLLMGPDYIKDFFKKELNTIF